MSEGVLFGRVPDRKVLLVLPNLKELDLTLPDWETEETHHASQDQLNANLECQNRPFSRLSIQRTLHKISKTRTEVTEGLHIARQRAESSYVVH